ncbi:MAG: glutamine synthetase adenylyltransferase [Anaerolineae bacterium]
MFKKGETIDKAKPNRYHEANLVCVRFEQNNHVGVRWDEMEMTPTELKRYCDLLLAEALADDERRDLLSSVGFADWQAAYRCLGQIAADPQMRPVLAELLPSLLVALSGAADPDRVLASLERFVHSAADGPATLRYLAHNPRAVEVLVTLFAGSQFLTEILLRNPEYFEPLVEHKHLAEPKSKDQLDVEIQAALAPVRAESRQLVPLLDALRRFQRWQLLRIGACDLLNLLDLPAVTRQLSDLADSLVRACLAIASDRSHTAAQGFAVIALGKLGGRELNYSSDVDLLFLAASDATAYRRLGERLIEALTRVTAEGFLYRVDMRLRPWGQVGALVSSLDGYLSYLAHHARPWERQALLKARVIAGDEAVGEAFLRQAGPLLFDSAIEVARADVHAMKQRTEADLRRRGRDWGEVKLGEGSIRDVEFVAQYLQLAYGAAMPEIRSSNTLDALARLLAHGLLPADEHRVLADGYIFLRTIEHHLQMMHYRQTHTLPSDADALAHLARRLGFQGPEAGAQFLARYQQHCAAIRAVYLRHLEGNTVKKAAPAAIPYPAPGVQNHVERMDPSYAATFSEQDIQRHAALAGTLDEDHLVRVDAAPLDDGRWRVTIIAYDYPGELSLICGLLFLYGLTICDGHVFTYEPLTPHTARARHHREPRRKIVDVFTVRPVRGELTPDTWRRYAEDLAALLRLMHAGQRREARGELAKRVAAGFQGTGRAPTTLYPIEIEIDNDISDRYTVLRIDAPDTVGFLYEFTNALAYNRIYIARVTVETVGNRVRDTLYVTDARGGKITAPDRQRELRAATVLVKHFTHLLPYSPNPESALLHFREFIGQLFQRPNWPDELTSLERPEVLEALARLLGVSDFLWADFLRMQHANLFPVVRDLDALDTAKSRERLQAELEAALRLVHDGPQPPSDDAPWRATLNAFKDREMFRIDMRHILGHTKEFWEFSAELTDLAEVVVNSAYHLCHEDLRTVYGTPCLKDGGVSEMTVCALGKCGGRELGFASDIELMFVYAGSGKTTGPQAISTSEFYGKVVQMVVGAIQARREGIFEIDLQLRPYGRLGSLAVSLESFIRYFAPDGPAWPHERQSLVKLRPIAGNRELGEEVARLRDEFVYTGEPFDVTAMRAMRERQIRHFVMGGTFNAKYSPGGLLDVEYLVQGLQITHGHRDPGLRCPNTREAMAALAAAGLLSPDDYARLRKAHTFLRWLIDALRVVRGNARDVTIPPEDSEEFAFLARRLRYGGDVAQLRQDLTRYTTSVQELSARLLG